MKIQAANSFFESLKKIYKKQKFYYREFWSDKYYEFKWSLWALKKYFKVVTHMRPWDSYGMIEMWKHQAEILLKTLERGNEVNETRFPKIKKLKRFIELVDNYIKDNDTLKTYGERCGYNYDAEDFEFVPIEGKKELYELKITTKSGYEHIDNSKALKEGHKLEEKEWKEMMKILKDEMRSWWD